MLLDDPSWNGVEHGGRLGRGGQPTPEVWRGPVDYDLPNSRVGAAPSMSAPPMEPMVTELEAPHGSPPRPR